MISAYFGPLDGPLYKAHIATSLDLKIMETWKFLHSDDASCAQEIGVNYPSISLFRFFTTEPFELANNREEFTVEGIKQALAIRNMPELIFFTEWFF